MTKKKEKTFIFIIGMHRSGTSLVANLLSKAGVFLGKSEDLLPPNFDNRYGFYENEEFVEINDKILEKFDLQWDSTEAPDFEKKIDFKEEKELAKEFIKEVSSNHNVVAFKDPRATLTLPFWEEIIDRDIKVLFVRRNPLEIADSLKKRNSFSKEKSIGIWENYKIEGLKNIERLDTLFVNYDDILDNPFPNFVRMLKFLDIKYDEGILKKMYFTLAPEVKHSEYSNKDFMEDEDVTEEQKQLLRDLDKRYEEQLREYPIEEFGIEVSVEEKNSHLREKISNIGEQLDSCRRESSVKKAEALELTKQNQELTKQNQELTKQNQELTKQNQELTKQNQELTKQNQELTKQNQELTKQNQELTKQNQELTKQNQELTKQNQELTKQNQSLNSTILDKNKELEKIYNSKSWRITQPIRNLLKKARDLFNNNH
jgi:hypothetical protein